MTATAVAPAALDAPRLARRTRAVLGWALLVVLGGVLVALAAGRPAPEDYLHPDGTGQGGTRALVQVLRQHGVTVDVVERSADAVAASGPGTTLVVGNTDLLSDTAARRLLAGTTAADRLVLLDASPTVLDALDLGLAARSAATTAGPAGCSASWVHPGDEVTRVTWEIVPTGGALPPGSEGCFPLAGGDAAGAVGYAAVELPSTGSHPALTLVGFPDAATNRFVTESAHAGLVVRLLGGSAHVVWLHADDEDLLANPSTAQEPVWPAWTGPGLVVATLALLAFAVARGRRLGRLVPEPLPVVVRAVETTESRAELYRAAADHARAAAVLRQASSRRLARRLGLAPGVDADALLAAVAAATGTDPPEVAALLHGPAPADEAALVTLARQLTHLEEKVRTP
ncbi:DUF4350 domain-containing protein [Phycicoccus endophyticus]|uniref:DUF4350 domain-containing protein n=1 Tax=Phycicoccus endophyticus TaxID=1690220 RepID=UPI00140C9B0E|nr:DUF4350 domain-containing protein [Phycicoccus endophyticus]NHI20417.1 DUF4350 domain-containing protein [Phycicoccus endophyticus]GGL29416.1 hypothetical protein GCM10012283_09690 [Phycicoccus endophyticus]